MWCDTFVGIKRTMVQHVLFANVCTIGMKCNSMVQWQKSEKVINMQGENVCYDDGESKYEMGKQGKVIMHMK